MKESDLISIVVPIYKVEKYINKCIESILNQTYKNLEIILVDDGSPDNCGKIADEYAKKDNRIKVIHKKNGGLSDARNAGIDIVKGKYIAFVDSDDYIEKEYIEIMYNAIRTNKVKIVQCGINKVNDDGKVLDSYGYLDNELINSKRIIEEKYTKYPISNVVAWNKLYSTDLFKDIRYPVRKAP